MPVPTPQPRIPWQGFCPLKSLPFGQNLILNVRLNESLDGVAVGVVFG